MYKSISNNNFLEEKSHIRFSKNLAGCKILALHGRGSNADITNLQLDVLGLFNDKVISISAPTEVFEPGVGEVGLGPWFTWLPSAEDLLHADPNICLNHICEAVAAVLTELELQGSIDLIYGFSQGCLIAHLVNGLPQDPSLIEALLTRGINIPWDVMGTDTAFKGGIFACSAGTENIDSLREKAGLKKQPCVARDFRSLHLIGIEDSLRTGSESFCQGYANGNEDVLYMLGGHKISVDINQLATFRSQIEAFFDKGSLASIIPMSEFTSFETSRNSKRFVSTEFQYAKVEVDNSTFPESILDVLKNSPFNAPFLRIARNENEENYTSYGQLLEFIQPGGAGDLRQLGVQPNQSVGYVAPSGGGALSAAAFLMPPKLALCPFLQT